MPMQISRRDFLKGTAAGAVGIAVSGLMGGSQKAYAEEAPVVTPQEAIASWLKKSRDHEIDSLVGVSELWEVK